MKFLWTIAGAAGGVLVAALAYFCFWPVPIEPVSWPAQAPPRYVGAFASNTRLAGLQTIRLDHEFGPEHIAMGPDGRLYAAMTSGSIVRMGPDGTKQEVFANTGGRVLGFDFDVEGDHRGGRDQGAGAHSARWSDDRAGQSRGRG
jgi:hypothetical protein